MRVLLLIAVLALVALLVLSWFDDSGTRALPERSAAPEPEIEGMSLPEEPVAGRALEVEGTAPKPRSKSTYEGVVHGPDRPRQGAWVWAYRPDGTPCGSARARLEGRFKLEISGTDPVTLVVMPQDHAGLIPQRRTGCAPGEVHEFHLRRGAAVRGRLVRAGNKSVPRVNLAAVPREDYERAVLENPHALSIGSVLAQRSRVEPDATFLVGGLEEREYVLVVQDPYWKLAEPIRFHSGSPEITGTIVPAATLRVTAIDIETLRPIRDVLALLPGGLVAQAKGESIEARFEVPPGTERPVEAELRAHGFLPRRIEVGDEVRRVFLHRERGPNVMLSVVYENGRPAPVRHAYALFNPDEKAMATESMTFQPKETGRFEGTLPAGRWKLGLFFDPHLGTEVEATIPPTGFANLEVELKRGGDLVLWYPKGAEGLYYSMGVTVARLPKGERTFGWSVSTERERILDLEPGRYRVVWNIAGEGVSRDIEIERDRETVVDLSRP